MTNGNIALLQLCSGPRVRDNLAQIEQQIKQLKPNVKMVLTPENALLFTDSAGYRQHAEQHDDGPLQQAARELARRYNIWLLVGSVPLFCRAAPDQITSSSLLYDTAGELRARYDKIHLFDVDIADAQGRYCESEVYHGGEEVVVVETPLGKLGMSICYDLRFPGLFQKLREQGAEMIALPAAFTRLTGCAHWEILLRARAIENQCFLLAPAQVGRHGGTRRTWGHSMIIDPWGKILAQNPDSVGGLTVRLDSSVLQKIRDQMPMMQHNRFGSRLLSI